jgi:hypothetical protein
MTRLYGECKFFATVEESNKFIEELEAKNWGYRWVEYEGMPDIRDYESTEDFLLYLTDVPYLLAATIYNLTEEEREAKPYCVLLYDEERNEHYRELMKKHYSKD